LVVAVRHRRNRKPPDSGCGRHGRRYNRLGERRFADVPLWEIVGFLAYCVHRVKCRRCIATVAMAPGLAATINYARPIVDCC
jgi:hypothetical protein